MSSGGGGAPTTGGERQVNVTKSNYSVIDNEFDSMRERFESEMHRVEDEMQRLRQEWVIGKTPSDYHCLLGLKDTSRLRDRGPSLLRQLTPAAFRPAIVTRVSNWKLFYLMSIYYLNFLIAFKFYMAIFMSLFRVLSPLFYSLLNYGERLIFPWGACQLPFWPCYVREEAAFGRNVRLVSFLFPSSQFNPSFKTRTSVAGIMHNFLFFYKHNRNVKTFFLLKKYNYTKNRVN